MEGSLTGKRAIPPGGRQPRKHRNLQERHRDVGTLRGQPRDPTSCPQCGAVFHKGRWTWEKCPQPTHEALCPACRRINDGSASGVLTVNDADLLAHRQEILNLARNEEKNSRLERPLSRIVGIKEDGSAMIISTTDTHLARRICEVLHQLHQGKMSLHYSQDEQFVRAEWTRDG